MLCSLEAQTEHRLIILLKVIFIGGLSIIATNIHLNEIFIHSSEYFKSVAILITCYLTDYCPTLFQRVITAACEEK